jgi:hypothetical protein
MEAGVVMERGRGGSETSTHPLWTHLPQDQTTPKSEPTAATHILGIVTPFDYLDKYCELEHIKRHTRVSNVKDAGW